MRKTVFAPSKTLLKTWPDGQSLSIWHLEPGNWTFCHSHDNTENRVGPMFPTKSALMLEAKDYLAQWGA